MDKIGFIGLGLMGNHMANRLIDAGCELIVWNRTKKRLRPFFERAVIADEADEVFKECDVIFTMLKDNDALQDVLIYRHGLKSMREGSIMINTGTTSASAPNKAMPQLRLMP